MHEKSFVSIECGCLLAMKTLAALFYKLALTSNLLQSLQLIVLLLSAVVSCRRKRKQFSKAYNAGSQCDLASQGFHPAHSRLDGRACQLLNRRAFSNIVSLLRSGYYAG